MARTRGASTNALHMDDGELLDKEGKPIPTGIGHIERMTAQAAVQPATVPAAPPPRPEITGYACSLGSLHRSMDAYDLACILDIVLGGLSCTVTPEEWRMLHANVRQHFRPVSE